MHVPFVIMVALLHVRHDCCTTKKHHGIDDGMCMELGGRCVNGEEGEKRGLGRRGDRLSGKKDSGR